MAGLLHALRALYPLLRLQPWVVPAMVFVGVLTALSEILSATTGGAESTGQERLETLAQPGNICARMAVSTVMKIKWSFEERI